MVPVSTAVTLLGVPELPDRSSTSFTLRCRSGDAFTVSVGPLTSFQVVRNLDGLDMDRIPEPAGFRDSPGDRAFKYLSRAPLAVVEGVEHRVGTEIRLDAKQVHVFHGPKQRLLFEETHWWLTQAARLADQWLDSLFGEKRSYQWDDFVALYRTNLNIYGLPTDDTIQECAVLSRLIYGFSAAYHVTGSERFRLAAEAGVRFQRETFRNLSHDGRYCFWAYGRRRGRYGAERILPSENEDDRGSFAMYEQIYALAGLALYYRLTLDPAVLTDMLRTVRAFNDFYLDDKRANPAFPGHGGYFSHIDCVTMLPSDNRHCPWNNLKKNWNSVGDHIPAYLVNVILALDSLPRDAGEQLTEMLDTCRDMLARTTDLIIDRFPDADPDNPYVNERFEADWSPDHGWRWQQNRAIIGHNFKIAWNLTRVANYCKRVVGAGFPGGPPANVAEWQRRAERCIRLAERLAHDMTAFGTDALRGGCFDAVERKKQKGEPVDFSWGNTKDFWQQEQAILAYLILYGHTARPEYLDGARETEAFWNLFFLDREHRGVYFRVKDDGTPLVEGAYGVRGGHSDASGYHVFELNYLAHIYTRTYVAKQGGSDAGFSVFFRPAPEASQRALNVAPDFLPPDALEIASLRVGGEARRVSDPRSFHFPLTEEDLGKEIVVEFRVP